MSHRRLLSLLLPLIVLAGNASAQRVQSTGEMAPTETPQSGPLRRVPAGVILVNGAVPSASDASTPLPEGGSVARDTYRNGYFGLSYSLPAGWVEKHHGPPPSETGAYFLALLTPGPSYQKASRATLLVTAQDLFFSPAPETNAVETIRHTSESLGRDYKLERPPAEVTIAGHTFSRFDYTSPVAQLHWYVLATEIRCHAVRFVFTGSDPELLESLVKDLDGMKLPSDADAVHGAGGVDSPPCVPRYAEGANVTYRVDPDMGERKFNAIPIRILIDKTGRVRHVHVISAFAEQSKAITGALLQWRFRPYVVNGQPSEVETGLLLGAASAPAKPTGVRASRVSSPTD